MIYTSKPEGRRRNRPLKDYAGIRFGRLVGVSLVERDTSKENNHLWRFVCDCGGHKTARIKNVRGKKTQSCGCLATETLVKRNTTHGLSGSGTYRSWKDCRARCNNTNDTDFKHYGGRGITVCDEWDDYEAFLRDMGERPDGLTLDRIDVDGNYSADNCRWADAATQANNKRNNRTVVIDGIRANLSEWSRWLGVGHKTLSYRLDAGWTEEEIKQGAKSPVVL